MKKLIIYLFFFLSASYFFIIMYSLNTEEKRLDEMFGKKVVINNDTLEILCYDYWTWDSVTLSNDTKISVDSAEVLLNKK